MKIKKSQIAMMVSVAGLILLFQNCAEQKFSQYKKETTASSIFHPDASGHIDETDDDFPGVVTETGGPNCREELQTITTPIRVLTVVDVSGSNAHDDPNNGLLHATDPTRAVRSGAIQRFYNTYKAKMNFNWGFTTFAGDHSDSLIGSNSNPLFGNAAAMASAIDTFIGMTDDGATPYYSALEEAKLAISRDTARPANSKYIVVFLSDGRPNPNRSVAQLKQWVSELVNILPGQISFNTVYYGYYDAEAATNLREMAASGGGNFLDVNANPTHNAFLITDLVTIPSVICTP